MTTQGTQKTAANHENALGAFVDTMNRIRETLDDLQTAADDHFGYDSDRIDYGHVGTAARILAQLEETLAIARHTNR